MIIRNKDLGKMLKEHGKQYTITMYINRKFDMTGKQLAYALTYGGSKDDRKKQNQKDR